MKKTLEETLKTILDSNEYPENIREILGLIIDGEFTNPEIRALHSSDISTHKGILAKVTLDYIQACLEDGVITRDELSSVKMLKLFFNIEEDGFKQLGFRDIVEQLLTLELEKIYEDNIVDEEEALTEVDLQEMFGLSYDEFYEIEQKVIKK